MFTFLEAMLSLRAMLKGLTHFIQMYISIFPLHIKKSRVWMIFEDISIHLEKWDYALQKDLKTSSDPYFFSSSRTIETPY